MVRRNGQPGPGAAPGAPTRTGRAADAHTPAAAAPLAGGDGRSVPRAEAIPEIRTEHLRKVFGVHVVLDDINLQINTGDIVAIVGASGSGKTVLLDCLTGLIDPTSGRVLVADHDAPPDENGHAPLVDIGAIDPDHLDRIRLHWAVVFQKNALFSGSVYDNIALWLREHTRMPESKIRQVAAESLRAAQLDVNDVMHKDREALSGGMAKRVAIARAIAVNPLVVFYDEPTTGLDPIVSGHIHELIWEFHHRPHPSGQPRTTVIVTHDRELLRRLAPRVIMLDAGGVCFDGPYEQFGLAGCPAAQQYLQAMPVLHARWTD
jgi:phospholipid/cholesterol/gamma-HCH transport system ATP-binding protein